LGIIIFGFHDFIFRFLLYFSCDFIDLWAIPFILIAIYVSLLSVSFSVVLLGVRRCVGRQESFVERVEVQILAPSFFRVTCVPSLKADFRFLRPCATVAVPLE
jgi:hypothetical protein